MMKNLKSTKGFTLIEIIVVLTVLAIFSSLSYFILHEALSNMQKERVSLSHYKVAGETLRELSNQLRALYWNSATGEGFLHGQDGSYSSKSGKALPGDRVAFSVHGVVSAPVDYIHEVDYLINLEGLNEKGQKIAGLEKRLRSVEEKELTETFEPQVIGLDIKYWDSSLSPPSWVDSWNSHERKKFPKAIWLTVGVAGEGLDHEVKTFSTIVNLPMVEG